MENSKNLPGDSNLKPVLTLTNNSESPANRMISSYSMDKTVRVILIGDSTVGKSCILLRYTRDSFKSGFICTVGVEFSLKALNIDGEEIKLQIWDTSGQEKYRTVTKSFYRNIMGAIIVFDLTNKESFNNINTWLDMIKENAPEETIKILVGNKSDLKTNRMVTKEEIIKLSNNNKIEYFETSAKDNTGINEAFLYLGTLIKREKLDEVLLTSQDIRFKETINKNRNSLFKEPKKEDKKKCC